MRERVVRMVGKRDFGYLLACSALLLSVCGCKTSHYYAQAIQGEVRILRGRQPIIQLMADPQVAPVLKAKFALVTELRAFAHNELGLPINKHYLTYVDLHRPFAVWNVHAAPAYSLEPKKWWYPWVGSLKYRGYFDEAEAHRYGAELAREGYDVYVEGVEAYSTLGWFADPLMNTFIYHSEPDLAEIIFHELAHQRLFFKGDTDFNEAFATAVAEEGVRRWFVERHDPEGLSRYRSGQKSNQEFVALILRTRRALSDLYTASRPPKGGASSKQAEEKARLVAQLRLDYEQLKTSWGGSAGYHRWFAKPLNNAQLNTIAVYYELVPGFQALLDRVDGDLEKFSKSVESLKKLSKDERQAYLRGLAPSDQSSARVD